MIIDVPKAPAFKVNWQAPEFSPSDANAVCCNVCAALCFFSSFAALFLYLMGPGYPSPV